MSGNKSVTISVHDDYIDAVTDLVAAYSETVRLGRFRPAADVGSPSTFPVLDPTLIEAVKQATIVITAGSASVDFLVKLRGLIALAHGKIRAQDDKSKKPIE